MTISPTPPVSSEAVKKDMEYMRLALDSYPVLTAALEWIEKIVHTPSNGRHAYTHFQDDFTQIRAICRRALR
jgi:hypothetical protein